LFSLAALTGCSQGGKETNPECPDGICGSGSGSGSAATGSSSSGGGCAEAWTCSPWQQQSDGNFTRTCVDGDQCGTTAGKRPEGRVMLPELDLDYYKCKVEPIFDRSCAMLGCHGTETGRAFKIYARGRLRHKETVQQVSTCPIGPQMVDLADM